MIKIYNYKERVKSREHIIYELRFIKETLSAIFNNDDPDHKAYEELEIKLNHCCSWGKIEFELNDLIDEVIAFNTPEYVEEDE